MNKCMGSDQWSKQLIVSGKDYIQLHGEEQKVSKYIQYCPSLYFLSLSLLSVQVISSESCRHLASTTLLGKEVHISTTHHITTQTLFILLFSACLFISSMAQLSDWKRKSIPIHFTCDLTDFSHTSSGGIFQAKKSHLTQLLLQYFW